MIGAVAPRILKTAPLALFLAWAGAAQAACIDSDRLPTELLPAVGVETAQIVDRRSGRMVVPVTVNGEGPFRFILDTGANRSVLSPQLVERLGIVTSGSGEVHSIHGVTVAPLAQVNSLQFGELTLGGSRTVPVMRGPVMAGEAGLLGVDGLQGRRLRMDFENQCVEISPSEPRWRRLGWSLVEGELRFGHLILIEGRIREESVHILIDTGSDSTLANVALQERLRAGVRVDRHSTIRARAYTAGDPIVLDAAILIPHLSMSGIEVRNINAYVADFHIFSLWDLLDEPTLLIGMDVLSQTRALIIDYGEGTVHFKLHAPPRTGTRLPDNNASRVSIIR